MGFDKDKCVIEPYSVIKLSGTNQKIDFNNEIWYLVNDTLDMDDTGKLTIESSDNYVEYSKSDYVNLGMSRYQFFKDYLILNYTHYTSFVKFKLEFLRIIPIL